MGEKSKRITNRSQYEHLVDLMKEKPDIARGYTKRPPEEVISFWEKVTEELNSMGPPTKDTSNWKKVWSDYKSYLKKKLSQNKRELNATGGGPYRQKQFNALEEEVLSLLNLRSSVEGIASKEFGVVTQTASDSTANFVPSTVSNPTKNTTETIEDVDLSGDCQEKTPNSNCEEEGSLNISGVNRRKRRTDESSMDLLRKQVRAQECFFRDITKSLQNVNENLLDLGVNLKKTYRSLDKAQYVQKKLFEETCRHNAAVASENRRHHLEVEKLVNMKLQMKKRLLDLELMRLDTSDC